MIERMQERLIMWLSSKLPRRLVYWCAIRLYVHATTGRYSGQIVPELNALEALKRWNDNDPVMWNPYNKVVQDHRDGTIHEGRTNVERQFRALPTPWTPRIADIEVREAPVF